MMDSCGGTDFSLYGREGDALVEGVTQFKYLGHLLDQTDYDWTEVQWNVNQARKV